MLKLKQNKCYDINKPIHRCNKNYLAFWVEQSIVELFERYNQCHIVIDKPLFDGVCDYV